jgi:large subunit ribosomal protein L24
MSQKLNIKKGDTVIVITGDDKGKKGEVKIVYAEKQRVLVEGVNVNSKHTKPNAANPQGGIVKKEAPVHISNLMIVCPETGKATRVGRTKNEKGKSVRYSKKSSNKQELK